MNGKTAKAKREISRQTGGAGRTSCLAAYVLALANKPFAAPGPKPLKVRKNKVSGSHGPSWPHTDDQKLQSRPVIFARPHRAIAIAMLEENPKNKDGIRYLSRNQIKRLVALRNAPKHILDSVARNIG